MMRDADETIAAEIHKAVNTNAGALLLDILNIFSQSKLEAAIYLLGKISQTNDQNTTILCKIIRVMIQKFECIDSDTTTSPSEIVRFYMRLRQLDIRDLVGGYFSEEALEGILDGSRNPTVEEAKFFQKLFHTSDFELFLDEEVVLTPKQEELGRKMRGED